MSSLLTELVDVVVLLAVGYSGYLLGADRQVESTERPRLTVVGEPQLYDWEQEAIQ